ncbi:DEAD/DEAH box helicase family protein [Geoalkalibacter subterraneus]|uniref:DEAD/DEAH box helicase family protein n=1 Tax=Geoalkalibacter subterraneus TaxID=483547 RepID=UPI000693232F|nr:DEAD/DEAH box helicase family protein [Geoalkalibacter subterraneus]
MQVDGSLKTTTFSRTVANELAKGYYPTFAEDVKSISSVLSVDFSYSHRGNSHNHLAILDPCAGEGRFLSAIKRKIVKDFGEDKDRYQPCEIASFGIELDEARFGKMRGCTQKIAGSFFDVKSEGGFQLILLNPPYNRQDDQCLLWLKRAQDLLTYRGALVFIIPEYEWHRKEMREYVDANFRFIHVFRSEKHDRFKQLVVFLSKGQDNRRTLPFYARMTQSNFEDSDYPTISQMLKDKPGFSVEISPASSAALPLLSCRDLEPLYCACDKRAEDMAAKVLERTYPANFDTSIRPLGTLRTAHAVQLAAMNSSVESVAINGSSYLAKYMLTTEPESYKDPETSTETMVYKPKVECFLMDSSGGVRKAKECGFDYFELNSHLSGVLLQKLNRDYKPLHETGSDEDFLREELDSIGLMPPQREAVKSLVKGYEYGYKGLGLRANTGTGKTWMARAVKVVMQKRFGAKRSIMVTEPHLVEQIRAEYAQAEFAVHVIDSWKSCKRLCTEKPEGLYLISYSRLRMHPAFFPVVIPKERVVKNAAGENTRESGFVCPDCFGFIEKRPRKSAKDKCPWCQSPLYAYRADGRQKQIGGFGRWISKIEQEGKVSVSCCDNSNLPYVRLLKQVGFDLAIFDECHNASNGNSNQGSAFIRLAASSSRVLTLTATISNGYTSSFYNLLWGIAPEVMSEQGWDRSSPAEFQGQFGAFKQVRKCDEGNRHRSGSRVTTHDTAGISPAVLAYTLPRFAVVDSNDFTDMPPVDREVVRFDLHEKAKEAMAQVDKITSEDIDQEDRLVASAIRNAAYLRTPDVFCFFNQELTLRGEPLGTVARRGIGSEVLGKIDYTVKFAQQCVDRGERLIVYTGNTQKVDMRPVIANAIRKGTCAQVDVLHDKVSAKNVVKWFKETTADVVVVPYKRAGTGLDLIEFINILWFDYTHETRRATQGDGRNRRVVSAAWHRKTFGAVRPCRYRYLVSGPAQEMQLSYTLEKQMTSALAEGEVPLIDPSECGAEGDQSFHAMLTRALRTGEFDYTDPSVLLKKMTQAENSRIDKKNIVADSGDTKDKIANEKKKAPAEDLQEDTSREQVSFFDVLDGPQSVEQRKIQFCKPQQMDLFSDSRAA